MTPLQLHTRLLYDNNGNGIRLCGVDGTYGTASCWLCTNRKYVCFGIGVCLIWINHYWCTVHYKNITIAHWSAMQMHYKWQCVITWCKMHHDTTGIAQSTHIQLQFQWPTVSRWYIFASYSNTFQRWSHMPHGSTLMPMLVEYIYGTVSFSLRTNSLYVGIVDISALACFSNTLQRRWHTALRWCWCWLNTYIAYILWNGIHRVGFGRTVCTLVLVQVLILICRDFAYNPPRHHRNCTLVWLLLNYNDIQIMLRVDADVNWIHTLHMYETISCWLWPNSWYVDTGACSNLNVSSFGKRYTMTPSYRNCTPTCYGITMTMVYGSALMRTRVILQYTTTAMTHGTWWVCANLMLI